MNPKHIVSLGKYLSLGFLHLIDFDSHAAREILACCVRCGHLLFAQVVTHYALCMITGRLAYLHACPTTLPIHFAGCWLSFRYTPFLPNGCGWALAAVSAVEAALAITYPSMPTPAVLSSQIVADCANDANVPGGGYASDNGCYGGLPGDALAFMATYSTPLATVYPDAASAFSSVSSGGKFAATCNHSMMSLPWSSGSWAKTSGQWSPPRANETLLMAAVAVQPVVAVLTVGAEFLSWSPAIAASNSLNWNGGVFMPFHVYTASVAATPYSCQTSVPTALNALFTYDADGCVPQGLRGVAQYAGALSLTQWQDQLFLHVLVVGYGGYTDSSGVAGRFWTLQADFGSGWQAGDGGGFIRVAMTGDGTTGPCGMYAQPAVAPTLGFVHAPLPLTNGPQPPNSPPLPPWPPSPPGPPPAPIEIQRAALLSLKKSLLPLSVTSNRLSSWAPQGNPCGTPAWVGVTCQTPNNGTGPSLIAGLNLTQHALTGALPAALSMLTFLQSLDLSYNYFTGAFPPAVSLLTQLTWLDLSHEQGFLGIGLANTLPTTLSALKLLRHLDLSYNHFIGSLPPSWSVMTSLSFLSLGYNNLNLGYVDSGPPSSFGALAQLQWLDLSSCALSGAYPPSFSALTTLVHLDFSNNIGLWSAPIPACYSTLTRLTYMEYSPFPSG